MYVVSPLISEGVPACLAPTIVLVGRRRDAMTIDRWASESVIVEDEQVKSARGAAAAAAASVHRLRIRSLCLKLDSRQLQQFRSDDSGAGRARTSGRA